MKKYIMDFCSGCKKETWHRIFRRYGHRGKSSGKEKAKHYLKRTVTWCLICQKRKIVNTTPHRRERHLRLG